MPKRKGTPLLKPVRRYYSDRIIRQSGGASSTNSVTPLIEWKLISKDKPIRSKRLNAKEFWSTFEVKHNFQPIPDLRQFRDSIDNAFEEAMTPFIKDLLPNDKIGFYIENENLDYKIYLRPIKAKPFYKERFLNRVYATSQSNRSFLNSGVLRVRVLIISLLTGFGRGTKAPVSHKECIERKRSVIKIRNTDNSCGYRAIVLGIKYHEWNVKGNAHQTKNWQNLICRDPAQKEILREFCWKNGLDSSVPVDIDILKAIDQKINYQIIVIEDCNQMFVGTDRPKVIYLLYKDNHFDLITSMTGYLGKGKNIYCKYCNKGFALAIYHRCKESCYLCRTPSKCIPNTPQKCSDCKVTFVSTKCFDNHKKSGICKDRHCCEICLRDYMVEKNHKHVCDELHCQICNEYYTTQPHYCHMSPMDIDKVIEQDKQTKILIAYDIECMLQEVNNVFSHTPILLISHTVCDNGLNCDICGVKERIFYGEDCVVQFIQYLLDFAKIAEKRKASITAIAHNSSGYDGHFILRELIRRDIKGLDPTLNGTKIMKLDVGNIRFIDSLLLFQRPLADLPKMFGLTSGAKGHFPHFLNTPVNQNKSFILSEISPEKFGRKNMSLKRAKDFDQWYFENTINGKEMVYGLKEEMIKYCRSDVDILLESMLCFRKLFIDTTSVDPLSRCFTLASIGLEFFRAKILPKDTIGITPIGGYNNARKQSFSANAWLDLMEDKWQMEIIREYKIGKYFADGVIERAIIKDGEKFSKIAFEYNGCYFHRHSCRFEENDKMKEVEERRQYYLRRNIYPVFVWECEWLEEAPPNFYERLEYHKNLKEHICDPRKALNGGRTNNLKFTHIAGNGEEIKYLDFTSLYPYVLSRRPFPRSHPIVYRKDFPLIEDIFGFISCKILPPKDLYLPVLPYSSGGKLTFPLCRSCADERNNGSCYHSKQDRCLTGTFVSVELQKAINLGYRIIEVYEVLHYPEKIEDLFKEYVNVWYKIKAEASGFPSYCQTSEQKTQYLKDFESKEGITLDSDRIESNPGLRTSAKLMLNSFWGKLAQRPDLPVTKIIKRYDELWDIYNDEDLEMLGEVLIEDMMIVSYKYKDVEKARVGNTSVAIASFVTAYARLKLYEELEKIENSNPGSVLYFDTDSIIFVHKLGKYCPYIGNFLGEMTDEIKEEFGMSARITEFHSTGPKSYAYKVETPSGPQFKFKAKGFTQTIGSQDDLNFNLMKSMATKKASEIPTIPSIIPQQQFRCNKQHVVSSHELNKRFDVTSDKRRVIGNNTFPYGYVDEVEEFAELMAID